VTLGLTLSGCSVLSGPTDSSKISPVQKHMYMHPRNPPQIRVLQSARESVSQPVSKSVSPSVSESVSLSVSQLFRQLLID